MRVSTIETISAVSARDWNTLCGNDYPFIRHQFLAALEHSGAISEEQGWIPQHFLVHSGDTLVAIMPCYLKNHSYGEYVFDWSWADAYRRHGLPYYPKLLSAIPFTPATGPRLCVASNISSSAVVDAILATIQSRLDQGEISSWHLLFPEEPLQDWQNNPKLLCRHGIQYHWHNRGYRDFQDYLTHFNSRKRKAVRKERKRVEEQRLTLRRIPGHEATEETWEQFFLFYQMTYAKRSGHGGYLNRSFFKLLAETMPEAVLLVIAQCGSRKVAGALNLLGSDTLYGRYWGCIEDFDQLHFETCYYQGIEHCLEKGLDHFDAGAQGEHKIQRGFEPRQTHSFHLIAHPAFHSAISNFVEEESLAIDNYLSDARSALPFKSAKI